MELIFFLPLTNFDKSKILTVFAVSQAAFDKDGRRKSQMKTGQIYLKITPQTTKNGHTNSLSEENKANTHESQNKPSNQISTSKTGTSGSGEGGQVQNEKLNQNSSETNQSKISGTQSKNFESQTTAGSKENEACQARFHFNKHISEKEVCKAEMGALSVSGANYFMMSFPFQVRSAS